MVGNGATWRRFDQTHIGHHLHESLSDALQAHFVQVIKGHGGGRENGPEHTGQHVEQIVSGANDTIDVFPLQDQEHSIGHQIQIEQRLQFILGFKFASRIAGSQCKVAYVAADEQLVRHIHAHSG
ncbi:hypothetical protein ACLKA6_019198 [Drosophila palustris]